VNSFSRFSALTLFSAILITACAPAGEKLPVGFQRFNAPDDRYTLLYPNNWTFQPGPEGGVLLADPIDGSYQVTVYSSDIKGRNDIADLGSVDKFGQLLIKRFQGRKEKTVAELRSTKERKDKTGKRYYTVELVVSARKNAQHTVVTATVDNGKIYTLVTGTGDGTWVNRKEKLFTVADSFVLTATSASAAEEPAPSQSKKPSAP
jgi:PsbP